MTQKLKRPMYAIMVSLLLAFSAVTVAPTLTYAQNIDRNVKCGVNLNLEAKGSCATTKQGCEQGGKQDGESDADFAARCNALDSSSNLQGLIDKIINILSVIVGIVAVVMIIVGGFKYITSAGDSNKVGSAKSTIIYAIVGLIIAALAQVIARFVLSNV